MGIRIEVSVNVSSSKLSDYQQTYSYSDLLRKKKPLIPVGVCTNDKCRLGSPIRLHPQRGVSRLITTDKFRIECECGSALFWSRRYEIMSVDSAGNVNLT